MKKHTYERRYKSLFESHTVVPGLFVNFDQFQCSGIRIRIRTYNLDPGQQTVEDNPKIFMQTLRVSYSLFFLIALSHEL
jgi:hypothetical protein